MLEGDRDWVKWLYQYTSAECTVYAQRDMFVWHKRTTPEKKSHQAIELNDKKIHEIERFTTANKRKIKSKKRMWKIKKIPKKRKKNEKRKTHTNDTPHKSKLKRDEDEKNWKKQFKSRNENDWNMNELKREDDVQQTA